MRWATVGAVVGIAAISGVATLTPDARAQDAPQACAPGGPPVVFTGTALPEDAKTYEALAFAVAAGTTRVEVGYEWSDRPGSPPATPLNSTTLDLGLWDEDGLGTAEGFRGWSGSRAGRPGQPVVFVQQDVAARGYRPAPIEAGTWYVDLGIAALNVNGADWTVTVTCTAPAVGAPFVADPVDPTHVADPDPGWYHGDFHMHGYHSNANAPEWQDIVEMARAEGLDFLPITDYVTGQHWDELGPVQRDPQNADLVIWPGREIITYFGHANALGETRSVLDYRHGYPGVSLAGIQAATVADGALFQVNHPDIFPGPVFSNFCRGCEFTLEEVIDWDAVTTIEVLTGPILASSEDAGLPPFPVMIENPFVQPAIDRWEDLLLDGHKITAVSGSDSKGVDEDPERTGYGSSATAVYAAELSRPALIDALRAGHAYVRTRGVDESPEVELTAVAPDGSTAIVGDTLVAESAEFTVVVRGGEQQLLQITRDGVPEPLLVPITADPFTYSWTGTRDESSGPLGTYWRVDTRDDRTRTTIGNPIFLAAEAPGSAPQAPGGAAEPPLGAARRGALPATGAPLPVAVAGLLAAAALVLRRSPR